MVAIWQSGQKMNEIVLPFGHFLNAECFSIIEKYLHVIFEEILKFVSVILKNLKIWPLFDPFYLFVV